MEHELIDDYHILPDAARVAGGDFSQFNDPYSGLFRPGYWTFQGLHALLFGEDILLWHVARVGWSLLAAGLLFTAVLRAGGSRWRAAGATILYTATCGAIENQYRLGTAEPPLVLLHLMALLGMTRPTGWRLAAACAAAALAYLVKEVAVTLLGTALVGVWLHRRERRAWAVFLAANALAFAAVRLTAGWLGSLVGGYSGRYGDPADVASHVVAYAKLTLQNFNFLLPAALALGLAAARREGLRNDPARCWAWTWLSYAAGSLALQVPFWLFNRYYFIQAALGMAAFIALVLPASPRLPRPAVRAAAVLLAVFTLWDFAANWNLAWQVHVRQSRFHAEMAARIASIPRAGARIEMYPVSAEGELEPRAGMAEYLRRRRPDLVFVERDGDYVVHRRVFNPKLMNAPLPPPAGGRPVGAMQKPFLQYSVAFLTAPRVVAFTETESWFVVGPTR
jgi:hypothetical protein